MTPEQVDEAARAMVRMRGDFRLYAKACLKVKGKDGEVVPFVPNRAQMELHRRLEEQKAKAGKVRALILKGRQQGISTYLQARMRWVMKANPGFNCMTVAHEQTATDNLFAMADRYQSNEPAIWRPSTGAANAKELYYDGLDSSMQIATAGTKDTGRSKTIQLFHGSEHAFWPNAASHSAGIGQAVPDMAGTEVYLESTGNGVADNSGPNDFYKRWLLAIAGSGDYIAVFLPWFWQTEYRREVPKDWERSSEEQDLAELYGLDDQQLVWRRNKIESDFRGDETKFQQEYPCSWREAFVMANRDTYIKNAAVQWALKADMQPSSAPLLVGIDPARYGTDRTAVVVRQGRKVRAARTYKDKSTMEVAGLVVRFIEAHKPAAVFIDVIGIGAGVYDRLEELGWAGDDSDEDRRIVFPVNVAEKAIDDERYSNKRAEVWGEMKAWLDAKPVDLCTMSEGREISDEWVADLTAPGYTYDSAGRLKLESKEAMRKDGRKSPDLGDALALTFAEPVRKREVRRAPVIETQPLYEEEVD